MLVDYVNVSGYCVFHYSEKIGDVRIRTRWLPDRGILPSVKHDIDFTFDENDNIISMNFGKNMSNRHWMTLTLEVRDRKRNYGGYMIVFENQGDDFVMKYPENTPFELFQPVLEILGIKRGERLSETACIVANA